MKTQTKNWTTDELELLTKVVPVHFNSKEIVHLFKDRINDEVLTEIEEITV